MMQKQIRLVENSAVTEFVKAAEECAFDIDVCYDRVIIDGKSLLGLLGMDRSKVLTVRYYGSDAAFEKVLDKYKAA